MSTVSGSNLMDYADRWSNFALANLLWVILALPLITLPAATAGLFATMSKWARGTRPSVIPDFFNAMSRYWLKASLLALLDVFASGFLLLNMSIVQTMDSGNPMTLLSGGAVLFFGLLLALTNLYVWPLLVIVDLPLWQLIRTAYSLALSYPLRSVLMLGLALLPVVVCLLLPRAFMLFGAFSGATFIMTWGTWRVVDRHMAQED
jgi:uncharacterized membrane protein YesL